MKLKSEPHTLIVPPQIQAMLSGVAMVRHYPSGKTTLVYVDGTEESAKLDAFPEEFFAMVSAVQSKRISRTTTGPVS